MIVGDFADAVENSPMCAERNHLKILYSRTRIQFMLGLEYEVGTWGDYEWGELSALARR